MWNKLTNLVKPRANEGDSERIADERQGQAVTPDVSNTSAAGAANGSVMSRVYEQHPNMSMFHSGSAINLAPPSPSASPSKGSKRSLFKRSLKAKLTSTPAAQVNAINDDDLLSPVSSVWTSPSPVKLIPKKIRASLQIDTFTAQMTKLTPAPESAPLPVQPHTPTFAEQLGDGVTNPSADSQPPGTGSIRSILRDRNTPGTGQSVRFFSRDAYRVISPNVSETEIDQDAIHGMDPEAFLEKLRSVSPENNTSFSGENITKYHSTPTSPQDEVVDMFSPPRQGMSSTSRKPPPFQPRHPSQPHNTSSASSHSSHSRSDSSSNSASNTHSQSSLMIPVPPADMSNLFDVSQDQGLAEIPISVEGSLNDDAIEEVENDGDDKVSTAGDVSLKTMRSSNEPTAFPSVSSTPRRHESAVPPRSILSPEGTVFRSAMDTVRAQGRTPSHSFPGEASDRISTTIYFTPDASQAKIENRTAYFTPEAGPPASPNSVPGNALVRAPDSAITSKVSQDLVVHSPGDLVSSLREQLELQQQLAAQFEVDLAARDELVSLLSTQLKEAETGAEKYRKEVERRQGAMRVLRRKVGELEKICRGLEEEVERSREESFDRSIMDEASEGALVVLQGSIGQLKGELEKAKEEETKMQEERNALKNEVESLADVRKKWDEDERELKDLVESKSAALREAEEKLSALTQSRSQDQEEWTKVQAAVVRLEDTVNEERQRHYCAEAQWSEEKADLVSRLNTHASDDDTRDTEMAVLRNKITEKEEEISLLKSEVEAQWGHAEKADEKIKGLEGEKGALAKSVQVMHGKIEELGADWKESEVRRTELEEELNDAWAAKEVIEHERDQLVEDVNFERDHAEELTRTLQEREAKLEELEQERRYATDNVARLEELLRTRDSESSEAQARIIEREQEAEQLRALMHKLKREHGRFVDEKSRTLDETLHREELSRNQMEDMVRQKAEDQVAIGSMKERLGILTEEVERLRRQVHELQQESADKDMKLLQLTKARVQDKEDKEGLNIALDSKQQELELLKRKLGVKGTGGSTPAPNRVGLPDLGSRRQSVAFATPSAPRPRPGPTVSIPKATPGVDTPSKARLGASIHGNSASNGVGPPSTVKATRPGFMGPPVSRRSSVSATPLSSSTSSLVRSTSSRPRSALPVSAHRRSSSVMSTASAGPSEETDKENTAPPVKASRKTSMIPA